jgi:hypothetical protein
MARRLQSRDGVWEEGAMRGFITGKDVLRHSFTIVKVWGVRRYLRCLRAGVSRRPSTFLAVMYGSPAQGLSNLRE